MGDTFKTVAVYQYLAEAYILKGRLESEGIKVFLFDEFMVNTDPLLSNAVGGVKIKVLSSQEKEAKNIIESISKYSLDNEGNNIKCPSCKHDKVQIFSTVKDVKSLFWFIIGFLFGTLPLYSKSKYRCENCKIEFDIE